MAKIAEEYRADIAWHTKRADMFRKDAAVSIGVRHDWYMKRANEEEMAAIIIGQNLADMLAKSERTADKKTDKPKNKEAPHEVNDCARYIREQRQLIAQDKRLKASKKGLIEEFKGDGDKKTINRLQRELQPSRYGWLLEIGK